MIVFDVLFKTLICLSGPRIVVSDISTARGCCAHKCTILPSKLEIRAKTLIVTLCRLLTTIYDFRSIELLISGVEVHTT